MARVVRRPSGGRRWTLAAAAPRRLCNAQRCAHRRAGALGVPAGRALAGEPPRTRMARSLVDATSWEVHDPPKPGDHPGRVQQRRVRPNDLRDALSNGARARRMPSLSSPSQMPRVVSPRCRNASSSRSGGDFGLPAPDRQASCAGPVAATTSTCIGPRTRRGQRSMARSTCRYRHGTPTWTATTSSPPEAGASCSSRRTRFGIAEITSAPSSSGPCAKPAGADLSPLRSRDSSGGFTGTTVSRSARSGPCGTP
jgi:hypothetical protein